MQAVTDAVLPIFGLVLLGYLAGRRRLFGASATENLNDFVVWMALPALLFQAMATVSARDLGHPGFLVAFWIGMLATFGLSIAIDRRPGHRLADRSIEALDAGYPNTGFMGIPLGLAVFGPELLPACVLASVLTAVGLFAFAIVLIEFDLNGEASFGRTSLKLLRSLARNPLVVSPLVGACFAATGLTLPSPVLRFTTLLGAAASPCALVTIGLFLAQTEAVGDNRAVARLVGLKLLVQPGITAVLVYGVFRMPANWAQAAVLLAALPTGTGPFMLAKLYNREAALTSRAILVSTLISVLTISLLVAWIKST